MSGEGCCKVLGCPYKARFLFKRLYKINPEKLLLRTFFLAIIQSSNLVWKPLNFNPDLLSEYILNRFHHNEYAFFPNWNHIRSLNFVSFEKNVSSFLFKLSFHYRRTCLIPLTIRKFKWMALKMYRRSNEIQLVHGQLWSIEIGISLEMLLTQG